MNRRQWVLLILLIVSIFLNYLDRSNLSMAAPFIADEFSLSPRQMGSLFSAFFWTYALAQLFGISGWIADRYPAGLVLAGGLALWSLATIAGGLASAFAPIFLARLLIGAGESLAYPCYSRIFASEIGSVHRGVANALLDAGSKLGPALGALASGVLLSQFGWRVFFVTLGLLSLAWLIPWMLWRPRSEALRQAASDGPSIAEILRSRSAWGTFLGHFCGNYFWFFLLTWLPTYFVNERHFEIKEMARVTSIAYFAMAGSTVAAGWLSDRFIARGASPTVVRKFVVVAGLTLSTMILPVAALKNVTTSVWLLIGACMAFGTYTSNHWAITQTLAGPHAAGRWTSLQNGIGNLSGILAAWLTGIVVDRMHSFVLPFVIAAAVVLAGAFLWGFLVGPVQPVWPDAVRSPAASRG